MKVELITAKPPHVADTSANLFASWRDTYTTLR
jgi:hypothetical protein